MYELSLVIFLTVLNAIVFGYILACVITLIKNLNPSEREYRLLMTEMKDYIRNVCINATVCKNIKAVMYNASQIDQKANKNGSVALSIQYLEHLFVS